MTRSSRIRQHIQSNVIGYIALFVALSGTALALPGQKSVKGNDIANNAVKARALKAGAVTNSKLADGAVTSAKITDGSVTQPKLGNAAVSNAKLTDDAVTRQKIAQGEVTGGKIDVGAVTSPKLAGGAVISSKVEDGSLLAADFGAGQISDGFAYAIDPGPPGFTVDGTAFTPTAYSAPRAGRLLLTATTTATISCNAPCVRNIAIFVDNQRVDGSNRRVTAAAGATQTRDLTSTGLVAVGPGSHAVDVRYSDSPAGQVTSGNFENNSITGVLLQQ